MSAGRGPVLPVALVAVLGALTGAAAGLGVAGSPAGPAASAWQRVLSSTQAAGTLGFRSVVRTTGASVSVGRLSGRIDFSRREATEVSVVQGLGPAQWGEVVVVGGAAYERPGTDTPGGGRFRGIWTPLPSFVVPPFAPMIGGHAVEPLLGGPSLRRVTTSAVGGTPTTEYQLAPVGITCVRGDGDERSEAVDSTVWVDGSGRMVRFENLTAVSVAGVESAVLTVTTFGRFGAPVAVRRPLRVAPARAATVPVSNSLAGCLLTPG